MKRLIYVMAILGCFAFSKSTFGQLLDEKDVTVTMDLQPILQLDMVGSDHLDFVFDDIRKYYSGIVKYGATQLKVSSSVNWDLWAIGTSNTGTYWDQQIKYGAGGTNMNCDNLPLSALELHQYPSNIKSSGWTAGSWFDYRTNFVVAQSIVTTGANSIYYNSAPYAKPGASGKYIYGHSSTGSNGCGLGGTYLTQTGVPGAATDYYYFIMDYRILPGLPAVFPAAGDNDGTSRAITAGSYAQPGVYTMNVKYVIMEDL